MAKPAKHRRTQERHFSAHHMLIEVARVAHERVLVQDRGWVLDALVTLTFSALAVEALCNSIGERVVPDWQDFDSSSPSAKLRTLATHLKVNYSKDTEPWLTARWLVKFRNRVAHAKPEFIQQEQLLTEDEYRERLWDIPQSRVERDITLANATRALEAANEIKRLLCGAIDPQDAIGLFADGWVGSYEQPQ